GRCARLYRLSAPRGRSPRRGRSSLTGCLAELASGRGQRSQRAEIPVRPEAARVRRRDTVTRSKRSRSDRLQPMFADLVDQVPVTWKHGAQLLRLRAILAHRPLRQAGIPGKRRPFHLGPETHAEQDVLVTGGRKHLLQPVEFVVEPGRLVLPEKQQLPQTLRDRLRQDVVTPEGAVGPLCKDVVQLQEIDDAPPP